MSLLLQLAISAPWAKSVLVTQDDELNALLQWCTKQHIVFVKSHDDAQKPGLYCCPLSEQSYVVFQAYLVPDWPEKEDVPVFTQDCYWLTWVEFLSELKAQELVRT